MVTIKNTITSRVRVIFTDGSVVSIIAMVLFVTCDLVVWMDVSRKNGSNK